MLVINLKKLLSRKILKPGEVSNQILKTQKEMKQKKTKTIIKTDFVKIDKTELSLMKINTPCKNINSKLLERIKLVFAKYKTRDIINNGRLFMKLYTQLNSQEKPMDFSKIKVF